LKRLTDERVAVADNPGSAGGSPAWHVKLAGEPPALPGSILLLELSTKVFATVKLSAALCS